MGRSFFFLLVLASFFAHGTTLFGRRGPASSRQISVVQLPSDYTIDLQLALEGRSRIMEGASPLTGTPLNLVGQQVFDTLRGGTSVSALTLPYQWNFTLVNNNLINAIRPRINKGTLGLAKRQQAGSNQFGVGLHVCKDAG
jgi:hypothetical protein